MKLSVDQKTQLLEIARNSIRSYFEKKNFQNKENYSRVFYEKLATFVTLTIKDNLRGCIGELYPRRTLIESIKSNAIAAAFEDTRFEPLKESEFNDTKIEISILSKPNLFKYNKIDELIDYFQKFKYGVILDFGNGIVSTYLPQVWQEISDPNEFLGSLSEKAGMNYLDFMNDDVKIFTYTVENFKEK